jgi:O-methyltransferase
MERLVLQRVWRSVRRDRRLERLLVKLIELKGRHLRSGYPIVIPRATYSPWLNDEGFLETFEIVRRNSLVDIYRCFELWQLVGQVSHLYGDLLEVGVWRGGTGCLIAERAQRLGIDAQVFLCDTFSGVVKATHQDPVYVGAEHADASAADVELLAATLGLTNIKILPGVFPDDAGPLIEDHRFRLCHIDVDVYQSAKDTFRWVWDKLVPGGVVIFDDYGFDECAGVTSFVNEETKRADVLFVHNLNGHGVLVKLDGLPSATSTEPTRPAERPPDPD